MKKTFDEVLEESRVRLAERAMHVQSVLDASGDTGGVKLEGDGGGCYSRVNRLIVTPCIGEPGRWRVTKMDDVGPYGHEEFDSRETALRACGGECHTKMVPGPGHFSFGPYRVVRVYRPERMAV